MLIPWPGACYIAFSPKAGFSPTCLAPASRRGILSVLFRNVRQVKLQGGLVVLLEGQIMDLSQAESVSDTTLPETNSSHLKMDGWNTSFFWGPGDPAYFQGRSVSFRGCTTYLM